MGGGTETITEDTKQEIPKWMEAYMKDTLRRSAAQSRKPFRAFQGSAIAGLDPMERRAQRGIMQMASAGERPEFGQGLSNLQRSSRTLSNMPTWGSDTYQQYASPFFEDVIDIQKRESARDAALMAKNLRSDAVGSNAFGGDREALMQASLNRDLIQNLSDIERVGRQDAWNQATNLFQSERSALFETADQQRELGNMFLDFAVEGQNEAYERLGALAQAGATKRQLHQAAIDFAIQEHQQEQGWARGILREHAGIVQGIPTIPMGSIHGTKTQPAPDQTGAIVGGVTGLLGGIIGLSDRNSKTEISRIGQSDTGVPIYTFAYKDDPHSRMYHGTMAQDILNTHPEAVITAGDGTYMVDYAKIDVDFYEVEQAGR